ncbi:hypothetical protein Q024_06303 [Pseudomonas aeruginosa BWHPSA011]|nr:hypothetical protein Q024_06303 [Pseudomonas aeruginosa BWHPSA011]
MHTRTRSWPADSLKLGEDKRPATTKAKRAKLTERVDALVITHSWHCWAARTAKLGSKDLTVPAIFLIKVGTRIRKKAIEITRAPNITANGGRIPLISLLICCWVFADSHNWSKTSKSFPDSSPARMAESSLGPKIDLTATWKARPLLLTSFDAAKNCVLHFGTIFPASRRISSAPREPVLKRLRSRKDASRRSFVVLMRRSLL